MTIPQMASQSWTLIFLTTIFCISLISSFLYFFIYE